MLSGPASTRLSKVICSSSSPNLKSTMATRQLGRFKCDPNLAALHWASGAFSADELIVDGLEDKRRLDPLMSCNALRS